MFVATLKLYSSQAYSKIVKEKTEMNCQIFFCQKKLIWQTKKIIKMMK